MSNRTSNRAARLLLRMPFWFSNRQQMRGWPEMEPRQGNVFMDYRKPSRRQKRARRKAGELAE